MGQTNINVPNNAPSDGSSGMGTGMIIGLLVALVVIGFVVWYFVMNGGGGGTPTQSTPADVVPSALRYLFRV
ncbi:MAG: hypothetical protein M3P32_01330 [Chloroflexota bacterium]|nr:hypothetical protein [Chloroflexota bacterium]